ncbi:DUF2784 domain-containing protein [Pseudomonas sp. NPDC047963]|uniref:DUF2784 domain-containing protein n=1 Tax=Stutzerimonas xanthomarina TaxID=271420 RepID=UPI000C697AF5|nr:DUF2784 domain-containing protein [Stutzerimonas xanthomarina]MBK60293.1 hypothetical protein [Pseudomonas sp.]MBU0811549.1 DUF2784 domain-containing protein [Gammaproteobacteria bacterium]MBK3848181.1 DUF2784 family protein [Stutzerimonas xanthomarina]MBU0854464.1 DUF2784 domain-containing protein [Gammaproteobacteria bacterium]MBU1301260.1 DUF2784 domain-containing protein [Gammaproteobacteria bacterium]
MLYRLGADAVLLLHLAFIIFVLLGGLLVAWKRGFLLLHLPAIAWGLFVELSGRPCPLTHWENLLRRLAGTAGYDAGFIEHYLLPLIYPAWLSVPVQYLLAAIVVVVNALIYGGLVWRRRHRSAAR